MAQGGHQQVTVEVDRVERMVINTINVPALQGVRAHVRAAGKALEVDDRQTSW